MNCPNCGAQLDPGAMFCQSCGTRVIEQPRSAYEAPAYAQPQAYAPQPEYAQPAQATVNNYYVQGENIPPQYRVMSGWAYYGLKLLFAVPVIGFVFLMVFTFSRGNLNRRSFARSYWCELLIAVIVLLVVVLILLLTGTLNDVINNIDDLLYQLT